MGSGESERSFEYTPAWVVAVVCFIIVFISVCAERALHKLGMFAWALYLSIMGGEQLAVDGGQRIWYSNVYSFFDGLIAHLYGLVILIFFRLEWFKHKKQESLFEALEKLKEELMLLGFISLLLTISQGFISHICIPEHLANAMLPCKPEVPDHQTAKNTRRLLVDEVSKHCTEGHIPFLSLEALHQLHIFIFVLAVTYVIFCVTTMFLGGIRISQWRHWEQSIRNEESEPNRVHARRAQFKEFMERAGRYWRKFHVVSWIVAFFKQFYGSITKSDYIALRSGFIREHCPGNPTYDFHKYMLRTLEHDFKKIVGVSWYLWVFVVIFLLLNVAGWHSYFWLSFLPLVLLLIVGAKLEHIITELAQDAARRAEDAEGTPVRISDELFWFHSPALVLYLIHFVLFQNSFGIAFFLWIWGTYSFKSCIMEGLELVIPRLVIGVIVQVFCCYSTLPLYALVSQMGSMFKQTLFNEYSREPILAWVSDRRGGSSVANERSLNRVTIESADDDNICLAQLQPEIGVSCPGSGTSHPRI